MHPDLQRMHTPLSTNALGVVWHATISPCQHVATYAPFFSILFFLLSSSTFLLPLMFDLAEPSATLSDGACAERAVLCSACYNTNNGVTFADGLHRMPLQSLW